VRSIYILQCEIIRIGTLYSHYIICFNESQEKLIVNNSLILNIPYLLRDHFISLRILNNISAGMFPLLYLANDGTRPQGSIFIEIMDNYIFPEYGLLFPTRSFFRNGTRRFNSILFRIRWIYRLSVQWSFSWQMVVIRPYHKHNVEI